MINIKYIDPNTQQEIIESVADNDLVLRCSVIRENNDGPIWVEINSEFVLAGVTI